MWGWFFASPCRVRILHYNSWGKTGTLWLHYCLIALVWTNVNYVIAYYWGSLVQVPPKTHFSIMIKLPVKSTGEWSRIRFDLETVECWRGIEYCVVYCAIGWWNVWIILFDRHEEVWIQRQAIPRAMFLLQGLQAANRNKDVHPTWPGSRLRALLRGTIRPEVHQMQWGEWGAGKDGSRGDRGDAPPPTSPNYIHYTVHKLHIHTNLNPMQG